ncbi:MAG: M42 family metallopeptidase [Bacilli bacterium]|jgi:putative aminopeptidase FrvX
MTQEERLALLQQMSEVEGVSGREKDAAKLFKSFVSDAADRVEFDNLGSVLAYKEGRAGEPVIMLAGHLDEVGFLVHRIEDSGLIRFHPIGGWWGHVILAQTVHITTSDSKKLFGVVGAQPPHGMSAEQRNKVMEIKDMYIDLGVSSKADVEKLGVRIGDMITPYTPFRVMNDGKTLLGKAWDDRLGAAIAIEVLKNLKGIDHKATVVAAGTVQEEVGLRGARTAAYHVKPDIAIALDVTMSYDLPGAPNHPTKLGAGVALSIMDGSVIAHRGLFDFVEKIAKEKGIKYTFDLMTAGGTDSGEIHKQYDGVITMTLSVPCRYFHSHVSLVHYDDYVEAVKLLTEVVKALDKDTLASLKASKYQ